MCVLCCEEGNATTPTANNKETKRGTATITTEHSEEDVMQRCKDTADQQIDSWFLVYLFTEGLRLQGHS